MLQIPCAHPFKKLHFSVCTSNYKKTNTATKETKQNKKPRSTEKIYKYYNKIPVKHNLANPSKLVVIKSDPNKLGNLQDSNEKKLNDSQIDKDRT